MILRGYQVFFSFFEVRSVFVLSVFSIFLSWYISFMVFYSPLALIVREASSSCDYSSVNRNINLCENDQFLGAGSLSLLFSIAAMYLLMKFAFKKEFSWKQYWFAGLYALLFTPLNLAIASFLVKLIPPTPITTEHDYATGAVISALFCANILAFLLFSLKLKKLKK